jgi:hypothetical protein
VISESVSVPSSTTKPARAASAWNAMIPATVSIGASGHRPRTARASEENVL